VTKSLFWADVINHLKSRQRLSISISKATLKGHSQVTEPAFNEMKQKYVFKIMCVDGSSHPHSSKEGSYILIEFVVFLLTFAINYY
jgi:hypothetical protein